MRAREYLQARSLCGGYGREMGRPSNSWYSPDILRPDGMISGKPSGSTKTPPLP